MKLFCLVLTVNVEHGLADDVVPILADPLLELLVDEDEPSARILHADELGEVIG